LDKMILTAGECKTETGPLIQYRCCPDFPAMTCNNSFNIGKADAGPFKISLVMQALKDPEKLIFIFHIESRTVVLNAYSIFSRRGFYTYLYPGLLLSGSIFYSVGNQVELRELKPSISSTFILT